MELVQTLALLQKPIVYSIEESDEPKSYIDIIANTINATRLFGYTQLLWSHSSLEVFGDKNVLDREFKALKEVILEMALSNEKFMIERTEINERTTRIDITLEQKSS